MLSELLLISESEHEGGVLTQETLLDLRQLVDIDGTLPMRPTHHYVDQASLLVKETPLVTHHLMASLAIKIRLLSFDFGNRLTPVESERRHEPKFTGRLDCLVICSAKLDLENLLLQFIDFCIRLVN